MPGKLLRKALRSLAPPASAFVDAARDRGVATSVAAALEPAARELFPEDPERALTTREVFERAAMQTVIGDAGNLELSFGLVDQLATAVETLGLARESDVPDPFRRVWIRNAEGARKRGVVLRCEDGEVAVFCPPAQDAFVHAGPIMNVSYRGFESAVEYDLRLNDAVGLPGAFVLHLTRPEQGGAIGRDNQRTPVRLRGTVHPLSAVGAPVVSLACDVLDVSPGGVRIASDLACARGDRVELELDLDDDHGEPLRLVAVLRWNREPESGPRTQGLQFEDVDADVRARYDRCLARLAPQAAGSGSAPRRDEAPASVGDPPAIESVILLDAPFDRGPAASDDALLDELRRRVADYEARLAASDERLALELQSALTTQAAVERQFAQRARRVEQLLGTLENEDVALAHGRLQLEQLGAELSKQLAWHAAELERSKRAQEELLQRNRELERELASQDRTDGGRAERSARLDAALATAAALIAELEPKLAALAGRLEDAEGAEPRPGRPGS